MRQPKCSALSTLGRWLKMTFTSCRLRASCANVARARAVLLPLPAVAEPGSEKQKKMRRLRAKSVSVTTSSNPPCPPAATAGNPASAGPTGPLALTTRMRPGRSVTRNCPSGRKATAQGFTSPVATATSDTGRDGADEAVCAPPMPWAPIATKTIAVCALFTSARGHFFIDFMQRVPEEK
jgi:hypothetical protein